MHFDSNCQSKYVQARSSREHGMDMQGGDFRCGLATCRGEQTESSCRRDPKRTVATASRPQLPRTDGLTTMSDFQLSSAPLVISQLAAEYIC